MCVPSTSASLCAGRNTVKNGRFPRFSWNGHYPWHCKVCGEERRVHAACYPRLIFRLQLLTTIIMWISPRNSFPVTLKPYILFWTKKLQPGKHRSVVKVRKKTPGSAAHFFCISPLQGNGQHLKKWAHCKKCFNSWGFLMLDAVLHINQVQTCGKSLLNAKKSSMIPIVHAWNDQEYLDATL